MVLKFCYKSKINKYKNKYIILDTNNKKYIIYTYLMYNYYTHNKIIENFGCNIINTIYLKTLKDFTLLIENLNIDNKIVKI